MTGRTTAEAITALPTLLAERRNDYSSSSASTTPAVTATTGFRVASPNETRRDLSALRDMVAQQAGTPAILITPPPAAHTNTPTPAWNKITGADDHFHGIDRAS